MSLQLNTSNIGQTTLPALPLADSLLARPAALPPATPAGSYQLEPSWHPQLGALFASGGNAANAASFDAQVRGQDAQAIDLELMQISSAVYDPSVQSVGNWTRVSDADLAAAGIDPALLENPETGFRAGIYTDGDGNHVLAFAGSNDLKDWTGANFRQGVGWDSEQYDEAVQLAQLASAAYGDDLAITGHSLGGGLAATAAMAIDGAAVTFNASGVHDKTIERLGLDPATAKADAADGQIRRYNVDGEALTKAQQDIWVVNNLPDAPGHEIVLDDPAPLTGWDRFNPISIVKHSIDKHMQDAVLDALQQQQPWAN
ncbi:alpha/beta hydrolase [Luteimonas sp. BDR2-5]|uniref:alpha/beta hydrolase family protein n=1 Tax=Proluteimonas luteida TaxID=2878685 RepID=UPI001E3EBEA6|nr:alpha/beta hydrolase family protein [Luteimonas sp. BDR2-5]MCD9028000.1 alpha/beta hydrolase [Luteimonas sp. BDR2-5]